MSYDPPPFPFERQPADGASRPAVARWRIVQEHTTAAAAPAAPVDDIDTQRLEAPSRPVPSHRPPTSGPAPRAPPASHPPARYVAPDNGPDFGPDYRLAEQTTQPRPTPRIDRRPRGRGALADAPTVHLATGVAPRRAVELPRMPRGRLARAALLLVLIGLGIRAGFASLAFMAPGGAILGWSVLPTVQHPFSTAPIVTNPRHVLTVDEYAATLTQHLTLDQELGQMMIVQFVGTEVTPDVVTALSNQGVGGVLLFGLNIASADQITTLNAQMQQLAGVPIFIATDQEGGLVNRLSPIVGPLPDAASLATPADAYARGVQDATALHTYGFNLNLAPVVDVGTANPQLYGRTFGSTPDRVAAMAGAYLQGLQNSGQVTAVPKHFPGLGATTTDPHIGMPFLYRSQADWEAIDLAPYRTLLAQQDVRAIMVTHEMIPQVDPNLPASLSPTIIGVLRQDLGFNGVVITDDLHMGALNAQWSVPDAGVLAVEAGADIITAQVAGSDEVQQTKDALLNALAGGKLTRAHINASVQRILALKLRMGLIPMPQQPGQHQKGQSQGSAFPPGFAPTAWLRPRATSVRG